MDEPVEQELVVVDTDAQVTRTDTDHEPPQFFLEMNVAHEETGTTWVQRLRMNKERFTHMVRLMTFVAANEHIDPDPFADQ